ncbi:hypothetical protein CBR_g57128 [Chara braunii]|uniref:Uncharacterized protein n=1 Tax=Chara braunii TaxID=69332 RepID=A0A388MDY0_CHABU|nr:hypothetical protein CBR_g57128 [Chara braunii]|eukprot:GBG92778.1 hypothetical protein CBR_g57128 [Chara braunii]
MLNNFKATRPVWCPVDMHTPISFQLRQRVLDRCADYGTYASMVKDQTTIAKWREEDFQVGSKRPNWFKNINPTYMADGELATELKMAGKECSRLRKANLINVFREEIQEVEAELKQKGFAIEKDT